MTALSAGASAAVSYVDSLTDDDIRAMLTNEDPSPRFTTHLSRAGEETQSIPKSAQMRAIYASDWFWELAAVCPNNRLWWGGKETDLDKRREGAPIHFPDYLMLFIVCCAGIAGIETIRSAITELRDPRTWRDLVRHMDQYVPEGWTRLGDLPERDLNRESKATEPAPRKPRSRAKPRARNLSNVVELHARAPKPPTRSTIRYWLQRWRGLDKQNRPLLPGNEYHGLREKVRAEFQRLAIGQSQDMGIFDKDQDFVFAKPDRNQMLGFDGVVFAAPRKGPAPSVGKYRTGEGITVRGTKFGITSCRLDQHGQSRVITSIDHIHKDHDGSYPSEQAVVRDVVPHLRELSEGGIKGLLVDSVIRGNDVIALQRGGITVVNHPHAARNPAGGAGNRHNATRIEKSHLRRVVTHENDFGVNCEHYIFAVGGEFMQVLMNDMGGYQLERLHHLDYEQRWNGDGTRREYHRYRIACAHSADIIELIPLFHTSPTSSDPAYNWGEVVRVYPPGSAEFKYLYGARNDTEVRHADLKARVKHLPRDVAGQELRLLGAAVASNALSWHVHLRDKGDDNVINDTA